MNTGSFDIFSRVQDVYVKPENITTSYDGLRSVFNIFVNFKLRPPSKETIFDISNLQAKLKLQSPLALLGTTQIIGSSSVTNKEFETGEHFPFILDQSALYFIEKNRKGDLNIIFELDFGIIVKTEVNANGHLVRSSRHIEKKSCSIYITIPRSVWVEKLLSNLGYQGLKLIEIPLSHKNLKEAYDDIIFEFNRAEEYFNHQDYNKCVAHCRHTLDALTRNLKKIKEGKLPESTFKWLDSIDNATLTWIDELNKSSSALASKSHHSGHKRDFSRQEAESIYLVILGLLNFVGHIK